jgi:dolichyldiphosphatase
MIVYVTTFFCTRELECLLMLLGQLACEAANFVLKRIIREERPKR